MSRLTENELVLIRQERAATQRIAVGTPDRGTGLLAGVVDSLRGALRRRRTIAELSRLDDHMLRDIGLDRDSLDSVAALLAARNRTGESGLRARLRRWNLKRKTVRELEALDDRALADVGIVRGDISATVERAIDEAQAGRAVPARLQGLVTDLGTAAHRNALRPGGAGFAWHAKLAADQSLEIAARRQAS